MSQDEEVHFGCSINEDNTLYCWGDDSTNIMTDMPPGEHSFLSVGETASCTLNDAGTTSCWGDTSCGVIEAPIIPMNYVDVGAYGLRD